MAIWPGLIIWLAGWISSPVLAGQLAGDEPPVPPEGIADTVNRLGWLVPEPAVPGVFRPGWPWFRAGTAGFNSLPAARRPGPEASHPAGWTASGGPQGGNISCLVIDPVSPSIMYAGTLGAGVFKSINGGLNWSVINGTSWEDILIIASLAAHPANSGTVYAVVAGEGVYKTTNGGQAWAAANTGLADVQAITLGLWSQAPETVYAGTTDGVYKSSNGGGNWTASGLSGKMVSLLRRAGSNLYAGILGDGLFRSSDSGTTWVEINTGLTDKNVISLIADPANSATLYAATRGDGLFWSTDSGQNWQVRMDDTVTEQSVNAVASLALNPAVLLTGTGGDGVFRSTDGGVTWAQANTGLTMKTLTCLTPHPQNPSTVFTGTSGFGVFKSTDGGQSWSPQNNGLLALPVLSLTIHPAAAATIYAGTNAGLFKSTDSGATWNDATTSLLMEHRVLRSLLINPSATATMYAGTTSGVFKTVDGGTTWTDANAGLSETNAKMVLGLAFKPNDPSVLYAATAAGIYRSTDAGANWSWLNSGGQDFISLAVAGDPATAGKIHATALGGIYQLTPCASCVAPSITSQPASQSLWSGESTLLAVEAAGTPPLTYQWYRGQTGDITDPVSGKKSRTYQISDAYQTGTYWVRVTNACGTADSAAVTVTVTCVAASITVQPQNRSVASGQTVTLEVTATGSGLDYQWYEIGSGGYGEYIDDADTRTWTTPPITQQHQYYVIVSNSCGNVQSATVTAGLCQSPSITAQSGNVTIGPGQAATLSVTATGGGLSYQWYQGVSGNTANPVSGATGPSYTTPVLAVTTSYWVRVTNACSSQNSNTMTVTVADCIAPAITVHPASQLVAAGKTVRLAVTATGVPLAYQWYQGASGNTANPVAGATGAAFITPVLNAAASYWVRVSNNCGTVNSNTASLRVAQLFIPVAAKTGGWRSDLDFWNTGAANASVEIYLLPAGTNNLNPAKQKSVTIAAGKTLQIADVLGQPEFNVTNAALAFGNIPASVLVSSRFFFTNATGGTYGMHIPSFTPQQTLPGDGSSVAYFHYIRNSASYRSNLGFLNGSPVSIQVEIRVYDDNGTLIGNPKVIGLNPYSHAQLTKVHDQLGAAAVPACNQGSIAVRVLTAGGQLFVYAMVIDNKSSDPVYLRPDIR